MPRDDNAAVLAAEVIAPAGRPADAGRTARAGALPRRRRRRPPRRPDARWRHRGRRSGSRGGAPRRACDPGLPATSGRSCATRSARRHPRRGEVQRHPRRGDDRGRLPRPARARPSRHVAELEHALGPTCRGLPDGARSSSASRSRPQPRGRSGTRSSRRSAITIRTRSRPRDGALRDRRQARRSRRDADLRLLAVPARAGRAVPRASTASTSGSRSTRSGSGCRSSTTWSAASAREAASSAARGHLRRSRRRPGPASADRLLANRARRRR